MGAEFVNEERVVKEIEIWGEPGIAVHGPDKSLHSNHRNKCNLSTVIKCLTLEMTAGCENNGGPAGSPIAKAPPKDFCGRPCPAGPLPEYDEPQKQALCQLEGTLTEDGEAGIHWSIKVWHRQRAEHSYRGSFWNPAPFPLM